MNEVFLICCIFVGIFIVFSSFKNQQRAKFVKAYKNNSKDDKNPLKDFIEEYFKKQNISEDNKNTICNLMYCIYMIFFFVTLVAGTALFAYPLFILLG